MLPYRVADVVAIIEPTVNEWERLDEELRSPWSDFVAKFLAVRNLHALLQARPLLALGSNLDTFGGLFNDSRLLRERQGLFLFREAAGALCAIFVCEESPCAEAAGQLLYQILRHGTGSAQQAVCENLAALPISFSSISVRFGELDYQPPLLVWHELQELAVVGDCAKMYFVGRSLVAELADDRGLLVVKLARDGESPQGLEREADWLAHLGTDSTSWPVPFRIPRPLSTGQGFLFRLGDLPLTPPAGISLHPHRLGIAFVAPCDYYHYPNEVDGDAKLTDQGFRQQMADNALLLGILAGRGIIHDALIPLFHNRVQSDRREDGGLYDWTLRGRLDRWLESCRHPNFGSSGLRDFEHFGLLEDLNVTLYKQLGAHFLSMLLVAASYFRNKEPSRRGHSQDGSPVDSRYLFDADLLGKVIEDLYRHYCHGFAGVKCVGDLPFDLSRLTARMIDEMGVDHHMAEVLRLVDQESMSDVELVAFLHQRGFSVDEAARFKRGEADIVLETGPHLGGFNQPISLPEMVEAVGAMAAMCVVGRFRAEHGLTAPALPETVLEPLVVASC